MAMKAQGGRNTLNVAEMFLLSVKLRPVIYEQRALVCSLPFIVHNPLPAVTNTPPSTRPHWEITHLFLLVVCSHSHCVRGVQSPPGQSSDGIPGLLHSAPPGSGARAVPGRVPVGQDAGDYRPDASSAVPRGR